MVGKVTDKCPNCGHSGMLTKSDQELTKKVVDDSDLFK